MIECPSQKYTVKAPETAADEITNEQAEEELADAVIIILASIMQNHRLCQPSQKEREPEHFH